MSRVHIYSLTDPDLPESLKFLRQIFLAPDFGQPAKLTGIRKARFVADQIRRNANNKKRAGKQLALGGNVS